METETCDWCGEEIISTPTKPEWEHFCPTLCRETLLFLKDRPVTYLKKVNYGR